MAGPMIPSHGEPISDKAMRTTWYRFFVDLLRLVNDKQTLDTDLTDIAGITRARGDLIRGGASAWENFSAKTANTFVGGDGTDVTTRTAAQVKTSLGYPTSTTDNTVPRFDSTAGNLQTSGITIDDSDNIVSANGIRSRQLVIADDAATSFALNGIGGGVVAILALVGSTTTDSGLVVVRTTSAVASSILAAGATIAVTTGVLAGTTGTDTKITISPHSDGNVYVENRSGASLTMGITSILR